MNSNNQKKNKFKIKKMIKMNIIMPCSKYLQMDKMT